MLADVTYIEEVNGQTVEREVKLASSEFIVKVDTTGDGTADTKLGKPVVTQEIEIENNGESAEPQDQCGNTERFRTTNSGWMIRVNGIVTANQRESNLTLQDLRDTIATMDAVWIRSDIMNGRVAVQNTVITQTSDLVAIETPQSEGREKAFEFQLQLGESQSES